MEYNPQEQDTWRAWLKETLERIEQQTVKTNGRVTKLERWQAYVLGFCACITILFLPILFLIVRAWLE